MKKEVKSTAVEKGGEGGGPKKIIQKRIRKEK